MSDPKLDSSIAPPEDALRRGAPSPIKGLPDSEQAPTNARRAAFERSRQLAFAGATFVPHEGGDNSASLAQLNRSSLAHIAEAASGRIGPIGLGGLLFQAVLGLKPTPQEEQLRRDAIFGNPLDPWWSTPGSPPHSCPDGVMVSCTLELEANGNAEGASKVDITLQPDYRESRTRLQAEGGQVASGRLYGTELWRIYGHAAYCSEAPDVEPPAQFSDEAAGKTVHGLRLQGFIDVTRLLPRDQYRPYDVTVEITLSALFQLFAAGQAGAGIQIFDVGSPGIPSSRVKRPPVAQVDGIRASPGTLRSDPVGAPKRVYMSWAYTAKNVFGGAQTFEMNIQSITTATRQVPGTGPPPPYVPGRALSIISVEAKMEVVSVV